MKFRSLFGFLLLTWLCVLTGAGRGYGRARSCRDIKAKNSRAVTGEYQISTRSRRQVKVYCEFGLGAGAYTFFHPTALAYLTQADVAHVQRDTSKVLLRAHYTNGQQPYGFASQLHTYWRYPVKALLNSHSGYQGPLNTRTMGSPYLFIGFLPDGVASRRTVQGFSINGAAVSFRNCDANGNSYLSLFANFHEKAPVNYASSWNWGGVCSTMLQKMVHPYSTRRLPVDYFMFAETHWGGCGCFGQTVRRGNTANHKLSGMAVGLQ